MNKVIPSSNEGIHYATVSKVSSDVLDFSSPSSGECYEDATNRDLVAPRLSSSSSMTPLTCDRDVMKMAGSSHLSLEEPSQSKGNCDVEIWKSHTEFWRKLSTWLHLQNNEFFFSENTFIYFRSL